MLPFFEHLETALKNAKKQGGVSVVAWPVLVLGTLVFFCAYLFFPTTFTTTVELAGFLSPLWLSLLVSMAAWSLWLVWRRSEYIARQNYIVLEIKPPRSLVKTPLAMEAVLAGLHHGPGESNWYKKYILGQVRPYWSLELASLEGQVHFFIWTRANYRRIIEAQVYAQYPGAQVTEAQDYTKIISAKPSEWGIWGCDFVHTKDDAYPIKTYVEYGLDKVQEEPEQVDPLANLVEFLGSMRKGEYIWLQLIIRIHKGEKYGHGRTWKDEAKDIIKKLREETRQPYVDPATGKEMPGFPNPTKQQTETMAAIDRNVSKLAFDVGIRGIYLAEPSRFDAINITGLLGMFKQFSSEGWNGMKPTRWMLEFEDYPWELGSERKKEMFRHHLIAAYRRRQFFHQPFAFNDYTVMSTEELATLYHIPSHAVESPALPRIQSSTGEAPVNLPT